MGGLPARLSDVWVACLLHCCSHIVLTLAVQVVQAFTATATSPHGWVADNINRAHLDYFFWLLAALELGAFGLYLVSIRRCVACICVCVRVGGGALMDRMAWGGEAYVQQVGLGMTGGGRGAHGGGARVLQEAWHVRGGAGRS